MTTKKTNAEKVSENIANITIYTLSLIESDKRYKIQHQAIHSLMGRLNFGYVNGVNKYSMCSYSFIEKKLKISPKTARKIIDYLIEQNHISQKITSKKDGSYEYQFIKPANIFLHFIGIEPSKKEQENEVVKLTPEETTAKTLEKIEKFQ